MKLVCPGWCGRVKSRRVIAEGLKLIRLALICRTEVCGEVEGHRQRTKRCRPASASASAQVVQLSLTVSVPITEFDGPAFVQNVAMLLEISPDRIKVDGGTWLPTPTDVFSRVQRCVGVSWYVFVYGWICVCR